MKPNHIAKMMRTACVVLIATAAILALQNPSQAAFFDDSILRTATARDLMDSSDGGTIINPAPKNAPISSAFDVDFLNISEKADASTLEEKKNASLGQIVIDVMPAPEPAAAVEFAAMAGLAGFLGFRKRRQVRGIWSARVVPGAAFIAFFVVGGLVAVGKLLSTRSGVA